MPRLTLDTINVENANSDRDSRCQLERHIPWTAVPLVVGSYVLILRGLFDPMDVAVKAFQMRT